MAEAPRHHDYKTVHIGKCIYKTIQTGEPHFPEHHGFDLNIAGSGWDSPVLITFRLKAKDIPVPMCRDRGWKEW